MSLKSSVMVAACGLVMGASVVSASPSPLNLTPGLPDVASGFISVSYDAQSMLFSATGFTQTVNVPPSSNLNNREFSLLASIDNSGVPIPGGTFSLVVRGDYGGTNLLLYQSSVLAAFGSGAVDQFEFVFEQQSGSLALPGTAIGTILIGNLGSFPGGVPSYTQSFSNVPFPGFPGSGNADTFVIPAPGAAAVLGVCGLAGFRRRR